MSGFFLLSCREEPAGRLQRLEGGTETFGREPGRTRGLVQCYVAGNPGRDDKWRVVTFIRGRQIGWIEKKQQVPPLRFASVPRQAGTGGMTISFKT